MESAITEKVRKRMKAIGKDVFISILYPALKRKFQADGTYDIDYLDVCKAYPQYAERAKSDKSRKSRLSNAKSILRNGWEREAMILIAESTKIDERLTQKAKEFLVEGCKLRISETDRMGNDM